MDALNRLLEQQQIEEQEEKELGKRYRVYFEGKFLKYVRALTPISAVCKIGLFRNIHADNPDLMDLGNNTFRSNNGYTYEVK